MIPKLTLFLLRNSISTEFQFHCVIISLFLCLFFQKLILNRSRMRSSAIGLVFVSMICLALAKSYPEDPRPRFGKSGNLLKISLQFLDSSFDFLVYWKRDVVHYSINDTFFTLFYFLKRSTCSDFKYLDIKFTNFLRRKD